MKEFLMDGSFLFFLSWPSHRNKNSNNKTQDGHEEENKTPSIKRRLVPLPAGKTMKKERNRPEGTNHLDRTGAQLSLMVRRISPVQPSLLTAAVFMKLSWKLIPTAAVIKEMVNGPQGQGTNLKIIKEMLGLVVDRWSWTYLAASNKKDETCWRP